MARATTVPHVPEAPGKLSDAVHLETVKLGKALLPVRIEGRTTRPGGVYLNDLLKLLKVSPYYVLVLDAGGISKDLAFVAVDPQVLAALKRQADSPAT